MNLVQIMAGRLKIECAERAALKPNFLNELINEKNILGFKLCAEAEIFSDALDYGLALNRWQAIARTNADPLDWCIYMQR